MTSEQIGTLKAYIAAHEPLASLMADGSDSGVMAALNDPTGSPVAGVIDIATVEAALHTMTHSSGLPAWVVIVDYAKNEAGDVGLRACCRMVVAVVGSKYSTIDFSLPAVQQILGGLVAGTLLTQGQADALAALSAKKKTLAETVLGVSPLAVTISDVAEIRRDS